MRGSRPFCATSRKRDPRDQRAPGASTDAISFATGRACTDHRRRARRRLSCAPAAEPLSADQRAFLDIYRELIEINTTESSGDTLRAAEAMAARLRDGGASSRGHPGSVLRSAQEATWWRDCAAPARAGRFCFSPISMWWRQSVRTGTSIPSSCRRSTAISARRGAIDDKAMAAIFVANTDRLCQSRATSPSATSSSRSRPTKSFRIRRTMACAGCCSTTAS